MEPNGFSRWGIRQASANPIMQVGHGLRLPCETHQRRQVQDQDASEDRSILSIRGPLPKPPRHCVGETLRSNCEAQAFGKEPQREIIAICARNDPDLDARGLQLAAFQFA